MLVGLFFAIVGVFDAADTPEISGDTSALVNGAPITRAEFESAVESWVAGGGQDTPEHRDRILNLLVDEELLIQHALALGVAHTDGQLRSRLSRAAIDHITGDAIAALHEPDDGELRAWYRAHADFFNAQVSFEMQREAVEIEWRRQAAELALARFLRRSRSRAEIEIAEDRR